MFLCLLVVSLQHVSSAWAARPNIIFALVDDLDSRTAAIANALPRVQQRMIAQGATFSRAYTQFALCSPSRATMLTGRYSQNTGVRRNNPPFGGFETFYANRLLDASVNVWLKQAGYRTGFVGKLDNNYPRTAPSNYVPPSWDYWAATDRVNFYGYRLNENGVWRQYGFTPADYATDVHSRKAQEFVTASADAGQPFLLFLWFSAIHSPLEGAPRHATLFPDATAPRVPSFNEADVSDKPPFLRPAAMTPAVIAAVDGQHRLRLRALQAVDEAMGAIFDLLNRRGLLGNTYIVFTGDNGFHMGEHRWKLTKNFAYEESIRIPLFVRGPGVPAGRRVTRLVGNADLVPTFAAWAGVTPPVEVDGRSFAPLLTAADPATVPWRRSLPLSRLPEGVTPATTWRNVLNPAVRTGYGCIPTAGTSIPEFRGVRTDRFTFAHYVTGDIEMYSTVTDPYQLTNRACLASALNRDTLRVRAEQLSTCRGDGCRRLEDYPVP
jgi:arylsulfatase A-like enzyme